MQQNHILKEDQKFLRFDDYGKTQLVTEKEVISGYSYRKVHYTSEDLWMKNHPEKKVFVDPQYQINPQQLSKLDINNPKIVLKRLYDLYRHYPINEKPSFFPEKDHISLMNIDPSTAPNFITQIGLFPVTHYRSLFVTQDFNENGLYQVIINQDGRFQTDVVDDYIPVYEESLQPIWGLTLQNSWMIILLKFWAKKNRSYLAVKQLKPFCFLQCFTNSNWKYFNLQREGLQFLNFYTPEKILFGKFILKTKDNGLVYEAGLIPDSAGYELVMIEEKKKAKDPKEKQWLLTIRSTLKNKWAGKMSVLDQSINASYKPQKYTMRLERDFMMNHIDFLNLFSSAFIASRRDKHNYFSNYYLLNVPEDTHKAFYIKFDIPQDGFLDFAIKQFESNRKQADTNRSRLQIKKQNVFSDSKRYLKCHFILAKIKEKPQYERVQEYKPLKYEAYQIEYFKGYNKGDARFESIEKGSYILRIRTQTIEKASTFVINYTCNSRIFMKQVQLSKQQSSQLLRQTMASLINQVSGITLDKKNNTNFVAYADLFEQTRYGFVGAKSKVSCPYNILIEIDPKQVEQSGYKFKHQFKNIQQPFSLMIKPGETSVAVLKKNKNVEKSVWPPKGVEIYRQK